MTFFVGTSRAAKFSDGTNTVAEKGREEIWRYEESFVYTTHHLPSPSTQSSCHTILLFVLLASVDGKDLFIYDKEPLFYFIHSFFYFCFTLFCFLFVVVISYFFFADCLRQPSPFLLLRAWSFSRSPFIFLLRFFCFFTSALGIVLLSCSLPLDFPKDVKAQKIKLQSGLLPFGEPVAYDDLPLFIDYTISIVTTNRPTKINAIRKKENSF